jgi:CHAD domain
VRAEELREHLADVLDLTDIEHVHDARVASRRLRAVLEIFAPCFEPKEHRRVLRAVKRLADALGERRDPDVQIDHLERFGEVVTQADRPGVRALVEAFHGDQARGNQTLARALAEAEEFGLHERLLALADAAERSLDGAEPEPEPESQHEPAEDAEASVPPAGEPPPAAPSVPEPPAPGPLPPAMPPRRRPPRRVPFPVELLPRPPAPHAPDEGS